MTTENVAILFTDIVGSTELSQRLSAEVADAVRREHFSILRRAIAEAGGTDVKNLGDGLMVVFGSASAALGCAVAMQQGVEQGNREGAVPVGLRVGLSVGEVANEDGDYFGDTVVEAARLCASCDKGQILATDFVRVMAGRRNRHECRSIGELTLKGLQNPIETVEVAWAALEPEEFAVPLPGRIDASVPATFVGRAAERAVLDEALKAITTGATQTVLISGEPGIGKTALSSGFARHAFENGAVVLYGRCDEDLGIPYQPWAEAMSHLVAHAPDDVLRAHVEARAGELARLVHELAHRMPLPES
ncbi:MAG TPA: adenylate/guanylate cyclase domain-containing protein, partial [Acidimicrobiales bacterium]